MFGLLTLIDLRCVKGIYFVVFVISPAYMLYSLGIPYRPVLRAGCPALVDSHANIVKVASSKSVAARVFLHNRFIAIIHYRHIYPGKPFSSDQNKQMRQTGWNAGMELPFDGVADGAVDIRGVPPDLFAVYSRCFDETI